jgi:hypothetical protein
MDADLVAAWERLCQELAPAFTARTYVTFLHVATAWALCRSRPAVTGLVLTVGGRLLGRAAKHWTSYERFFYKAAWSPAAAGRLLLARVAGPLVDAAGAGGPGAAVGLAIDDTTCGRFRDRVAFAGYFKDASASNVAGKACHWAHNWVIGCVTFRCRRWPQWVIALPVLFELYRKKADCDPKDKARPFRSRHEIAAAMVRAAREALPGRRLEVAADGQYATRVLCAELRAGESLVSRVRRDAALHALPPTRRAPGRRGPLPLKGRRLPTPLVMAARRTAGWRDVEVLAYGKRVAKRVLAVVCLWTAVRGYAPIKLLIVRDPAGAQDDDFFFCTDPAEPDERIIERAAARWPVEEVVRDAKQHGGMEKVQGWCARTVERQVPVALVVQALVKAWYVAHAAPRGAAAFRPGGPNSCPWLAHPKSHPSYLDMLACLRWALWRSRMPHDSALSRRVGGVMKALRYTLCGAT